MNKIEIGNLKALLTREIGSKRPFSLSSGRDLGLLNLKVLLTILEELKTLNGENKEKETKWNVSQNSESLKRCGTCKLLTLGVRGITPICKNCYDFIDKFIKPKKGA